MTAVLIVLGIAVLIGFLAWAVSRSLRPSDERVAQFGPVFETLLRATRVANTRDGWEVADAERGLRTQFDLVARGVFVTCEPLGEFEDPDHATAIHAMWERPEEQPGAPFELEPRNPERPPSPELIAMLAPHVEELRTQPVSSVGVLVPWMQVTIDAPGDGAEAARAAARAYPALRDMWTLLSQVPATSAGAGTAEGQ